MRRLAAIVLIVAWAAIPACAQHGASSGGFGGHSGPSSHGGFGRGGFGRSRSASHGGFGGFNPSSHGGFARYAPPQFRAASRPGNASAHSSLFSGSFTFPSSEFPNAAQAFRHNSFDRFTHGAASPDHRRHHNPFRRPFRRFFGGYESEYSGYFASGWGGWIAPYLWAYPGFSGCPDMWNGWDCWDDDAMATLGYGPPGYYAQPPYQYQDQGEAEPPSYAGPPAYLSLPAAQSASSRPALPDLDPNGRGKVTLIFKDGRPPEEIRNYLLTPDTIYVLDQHNRAIPLNSLNLAATAKANAEDGDFILPANSKQ